MLLFGTTKKFATQTIDPVWRGIIACVVILIIDLVIGYSLVALVFGVLAAALGGSIILLVITFLSPVLLYVAVLLLYWLWHSTRTALRTQGKKGLFSSFVIPFLVALVIAAGTNYYLDIPSAEFHDRAPNILDLDLPFGKSLTLPYLMLKDTVERSEAKKERERRKQESAERAQSLIPPPPVTTPTNL